MTKKLSTFEEVKKAVDSGKTVHWHHEGYEVVSDLPGRYMIHCISNDHWCGLGNDYFDGKYPECNNFYTND